MPKKSKKKSINLKAKNNCFKEALLYQKLSDNTVRCLVCERKCLISENSTGYCQTRFNQKGKLYSLVYGVISSLNNDPIEKKPVFHYQPGSFCLSLGTFGCNFRCLFCQNWEISFAKKEQLQNLSPVSKTSPEKIIKLARQSHSAGIAITYNEPAIWLEYSLDVFKLAKKENLYTVWVTNGYATQQTLELIAPFLDVYRVDLKSFNDTFYQKLINVPKAAPVFENTKYLHDRFPQIHLECVTNIIPGWNDQPENLKKIARWIKDNLGPQTPWHVTRFYPAAQLLDIPPTSPDTLFQARKIGQDEGLEFVYIGNLAVEEEDDTFCPKCGNLAIQRNGYSTKILNVDPSGSCLTCHYPLNIKL